MGYVLKRSAAAELRMAINSVIQGVKYITPLIDWKPTKLNRSEHGAWSKLTQRQREVLQLVAKGCANKEIAILLHISEKTVDYHKASIKRELSLNSTAELTQFAIRHRIIGL